MTQYLIGVGRAEFTLADKGLQMCGMSDPSQKSTTAISGIYARAFYVRLLQESKPVVIVVADIWACSQQLKAAVIAKLVASGNTEISEQNLMIAGTHTHSAPGGFMGYKLYDQPSGEINPRVLGCYTDGIVNAVMQSISSRKPGRIFSSSGQVTDCGWQRSMPAFMNNPVAERNRFPSGDTDKWMLLLKFTQVAPGGDQLVGILNWFAIHPVDLGQQNTKVSGDNKGLAALSYEADEAAKGNHVVVAFANANCGDISVGIDVKKTPHNDADDLNRMEKHALTQKTAAQKLAGTATEELSGSIEIRYNKVKMSNVTSNGTRLTWPAALGLSFSAGSSEDSIPRFEIAGIICDVPGSITEGLRLQDISHAQEVATIAALGLAVPAVLIAPIVGTVAALSGIATFLGTVTTPSGFRAVSSLAMSIAFGTTPPVGLSDDMIAGHGVKPIVLAPQDDETLLPSTLPLQILRIGNFAILGFPGELTTMAGRYLRETVLKSLQFEGGAVTHLALGTYANNYCQYVTTAEEYDMQNYEGASNLFGRRSIDAFKSAYLGLPVLWKTTPPAQPAA